MYNKVTDKTEDFLISLCGKENVVRKDIVSLSAYSKDESEVLPVMPEIAVIPRSTDIIVEIVKYLAYEKIPITVRGGGTSVTGGSIPVFGGAVISTAGLNQIIDIDKENFCAVVQPGIILRDFDTLVENENLFYPPDPNSIDTCSLGGNAAVSAGGPRALKYGITRNYILNLKTVFPDCTISNYSGKYEKVSTGYNLNHMIIGSEGTLGIISEMIVKLIPKPPVVIDMLVPFAKFEDAAKIIPEVINKNFGLAVCEFIDSDSIKYSEKFLNKKFQYSDEAEAQLLIQIDGFDENEINKKIESAGEIFLNNGALDVFVASDEKTKNKIWEMRRTLRDALKHIGKEKIGEDVVVPRNRIPDLLNGIKIIGNDTGIKVAAYGHAGDGNVHVNVVKDDMEKQIWDVKKIEAIEKILKLSIKLGGSISGEHGIGFAKKKYLNWKLTEKEINIMKKIKYDIDPDNIMNPGKIF
ncbi:FAD-binding protein [Candidatus Dependentiae bacterium]|nr:FAD-binding protein [Candidatus Dependentiae bacterium]